MYGSGSTTAPNGVEAPVLVADAPCPAGLPLENDGSSVAAVECWILPRCSRSCSCRRRSASSPSDKHLRGRVRGMGRSGLEDQFDAAARRRSGGELVPANRQKICELRAAKAG
jgi:hypothetical protein